MLRKMIVVVAAAVTLGGGVVFYSTEASARWGGVGWGGGRGIAVGGWGWRGGGIGVARIGGWGWRRPGWGWGGPGWGWGGPGWGRRDCDRRQLLAVGSDGLGTGESLGLLISEDCSVLTRFMA